MITDSRSKASLRVLIKYASIPATSARKTESMDYVDVVVHIFQTELRGFYRLEELWADAPMTKYE